MANTIDSPRRRSTPAQKPVLIEDLISVAQLKAAERAAEPIQFGLSDNRTVQMNNPRVVTDVQARQSKLIIESSDPDSTHARLVFVSYGNTWRLTRCHSV